MAVVATARRRLDATTMEVPVTPARAAALAAPASPGCVDAAACSLRKTRRSFACLGF